MASFAVALPGGRQVTHTLPPPCRSKAEVAAWLGNVRVAVGVGFPAEWRTLARADGSTPGISPG